MAIENPQYLDYVHLIETKEDTMSTTAERLATLNALRATKGKAPIKAWKESRAKLEAAIAALTEQVKAPKAPVEVSKAKLSHVLKGAMAPRARDFAEWCRQNDVNPKVARAKLRRAGIEKDEKGNYPLNDQTVAIVKK